MRCYRYWRSDISSSWRKQIHILLLVLSEGIICAFFTQRLSSRRCMPIGCWKSERPIYPLLYRYMPTPVSARPLPAFCYFPFIHYNIYGIWRKMSHVTMTSELVSRHYTKEKKSSKYAKRGTEQVQIIRQHKKPPGRIILSFKRSDAASAASLQFLTGCAGDYINKI